MMTHAVYGRMKIGKCVKVDRGRPFNSTILYIIYIILQFVLGIACNLSCVQNSPITAHTRNECDFQVSLVVLLMYYLLWIRHALGKPHVSMLSAIKASTNTNLVFLMSNRTLK